MHRRSGSRRRVQFGMQQQCADTDEFDHLGERGLVILVAGVLEARRRDRAEIGEDFLRIAGQRAMLTATGEAEAAEETAAPFDQRIGAHVDRHFRGGQQGFKAEFGIGEPGRTVAMQSFEQTRRQRGRDPAVVIEFERIEPVPCIGAAASAEIADERTLQLASADPGTDAGEGVAEFAVADRRGRHLSPEFPENACIVAVRAVVPASKWRVDRTRPLAYSAGMAETPNLVNEFAEISGRLDRLVELVHRLTEENRSLRTSQEQLNTERANLMAKNEQARSRVEAMIVRLRSLESNA